MPPSQNQVKDAIEAALLRLFHADRKLLVDDANERSIAHRLAMYLEAEFDAFEPDYVVDVEYNRVTSANGVTDSIKKRVDYDRLSTDCKGRKIQDDDTNAQTVFPDIIVHERGTSDHNLLVIELKKTSSTDAGNCDKEKLERFQEDLGYEHSLFLKLQVGEEPGLAAGAVLGDMDVRPDS